MNDLHIPPEDTLAKPRPQRLGSGFLGGEHLGITAGPTLPPPVGPEPFLFGIKTVRETVTEMLKGFLDPTDIAKVGAKADDHIQVPLSVCAGFRCRASIIRTSRVD